MSRDEISAMIKQDLVVVENEIISVTAQHVADENDRQRKLNKLIFLSGERVALSRTWESVTGKMWVDEPQ